MLGRSARSRAPRTKAVTKTRCPPRTAAQAKPHASPWEAPAMRPGPVPSAPPAVRETRAGARRLACGPLRATSRGARVNYSMNCVRRPAPARSTSTFESVFPDTSRDARWRFANDAHRCVARGVVGDGRVRGLLQDDDVQALSATTLSHGAKVTRQSIVKHPQVLEGAGLVAHEKRGREALCALKPERLDDARDYPKAVSACWIER